MAILTFEKAYLAAEKTLKNENRAPKMILEAGVESFSEREKYDIFLSHSIKDAKAVLGVKEIFKSKGFNVYVDLLDDPQLDRSMVDRNTARKIRERMTVCNKLLYLCSENAIKSKWTPWELGFMDGQERDVFILPIKKIYTDTFNGVEYLSIYPYIDFTADDIYINNNGIRTIFRK